MTADDIDAPCNGCQYADYSPFGEPCVSCGFDCHNFMPRKGFKSHSEKIAE